MEIKLTKSPKVIFTIAQLFQHELELEDIYGTVYTSPKIGNFLNKLNQDGDDKFLIAAESEALLGAVQFRILQEDTLHINNIVVSSHHRGRGAGRQLLEWLIKRASCLGLNITLDVNLNNQKAFSWYKRMGFLQISSTSNAVYLCDGVNSLDEMFCFDSVSNLKEYGFSEARLSDDTNCRFFCVMENYVRLRSGSIITAEEVFWFKRNFNGFLIVNLELIDGLNISQPYFIQRTKKMELKCG